VQAPKNYRFPVLQKAFSDMFDGRFAPRLVHLSFLNYGRYSIKWNQRPPGYVSE